jgi:hypothetical protein
MLACADSDTRRDSPRIASAGQNACPKGRRSSDHLRLHAVAHPCARTAPSVLSPRFRCFPQVSSSWILGAPAIRIGSSGYVTRSLLSSANGRRHAEAAIRNSDDSGAAGLASPQVPAHDLDEACHCKGDPERQQKPFPGCILERLPVEVAEQRSVQSPNERRDCVKRCETLPREAQCARTERYGGPPPGMNRATAINSPPRSASWVSAHLMDFRAFWPCKKASLARGPKRRPMKKATLSPRNAPQAAAVMIRAG